MEGTSCGENCPFVKQGFCSSEKECPNYVESFWKEGTTQQTKLIKDCSPKRILIQQQQMEHRLEGVQSALEQERNEYFTLSEYLKGIVELCKCIITKAGAEDDKIPDKSRDIVGIE